VFGYGIGNWIGFGTGIEIGLFFFYGFGFGNEFFLIGFF
jgi:hypothetical protein